MVNFDLEAVVAVFVVVVVVFIVTWKLAKIQSQSEESVREAGNYGWYKNECTDFKNHFQLTVKIDI